MRARDRIYAEPRTDIVDFAFDEQVASVFPDMLRRSVPGYETIISLLGVIAAKYARDDTRVYDLGCSLGAATMSMHNQLKGRVIEYVAVDSSEAMVGRCQENLSAHFSSDNFECRQQDIRQTGISNASVVVLNFTLQFLPPKERQDLLDQICSGINPGGVLILSEKTGGATSAEDNNLSDLYYRFKAGNGYSELEISQKRNALEKVMVLDSVDAHVERLNVAGFNSVELWFRCFNFCSLLAVK